MPQYDWLQGSSNVDSKHLKIPSSVLFRKIKSFLLYANDSVHPRCIIDSEQRHVLALKMEAYTWLFPFERCG